MRIKTVKRYYCDHCSKGGFRKPDMEKHERACIYNPARRHCFLCSKPTPCGRDLEECTPTAEVWEACDCDIEKLRNLTDGCPACMLAVIAQDRKENGFKPDYETGEFYNPFGDFNYKEALAEWKAEEAQEREEQRERNYF